MSMLSTYHNTNETNPRDSDIPVCNGAACIAAQLMNQPVHIPSFKLGMHQDEEWDPERHHNVGADSELIEESYEGNVGDGGIGAEAGGRGKVLRLVPDRWMKILDQIRRRDAEQDQDHVLTIAG